MTLSFGMLAMSFYMVIGPSLKEFLTTFPKLGYHQNSATNLAHQLLTVLE